MPMPHLLCLKIPIVPREAIKMAHEVSLKKEQTHFYHSALKAIASIKKKKLKKQTQVPLTHAFKLYSSKGIMLAKTYLRVRHTKH